MATTTRHEAMRKTVWPLSMHSLKAAGNCLLNKSENNASASVRRSDGNPLIEHAMELVARARRQEAHI